jgi:hypothetical protein
LETTIGTTQGWTTSPRRFNAQPDQLSVQTAESIGELLGH